MEEYDLHILKGADFTKSFQYALKSGAHTHTVSVGNTGSGQAHENRPPYYALAYTMKL